LILYRNQDGWIVQIDGAPYRLRDSNLSALLSHQDLHGYLASYAGGLPLGDDAKQGLLPPIEDQEVWASGVTYYRSRNARMDESKIAGGGDFYDRVYSADRPELFFKAMGYKVVGPEAEVRIRSDAQWSVPEPELTLVINPFGQIVGYTIGNDMSSRDIEGANPLYLPQAKVYDGSCALGPGILIQKDPLVPSTKISLEIRRGQQTEFNATIHLSEMKRDPKTLVDFLFRDQSFPHGCFLLTGTGIVPPDSFTLQAGDQIQISIDGIGTLVNRVA
jgi:2-dehydro-3-deoxy-D-arabinonate dehydratase